MNKIKVSNDRIPGIVRAIDEIAFQTSIVALNAAVEAACKASSPLPPSSRAAGDTLALVEESIPHSPHHEAGDGESRVALTESEALHRMAEHVRRMGCTALPAQVTVRNVRPFGDLR